MELQSEKSRGQALRIDEGFFMLIGAYLGLGTSLATGDDTASLFSWAEPVHHALWLLDLDASLLSADL